MTGNRIYRRLALLMLVALLVSGLAAACGGGDDNDDAAPVTTPSATAETDDASDGAEQEPTEAEVEPDEPGATATEAIPAASATPESETGALDPAMLVIPEARDESIPQEGRVLGNPEAAVKIVEYGDFQ